MKYIPKVRTPEEAKLFAEEVAKLEEQFAHRGAKFEATRSPLIVELNSNFEASEARLQTQLAAIQEKIMANPNADGWLRLCEILKVAKQDLRITSSEGASDFLDVVFEIASDAWTSSNAIQALNPLLKILKSEEQAKFGKNSKGKPKPRNSKLPNDIIQKYEQLLRDKKSPKDAKSILCQKYKVTSQGLSKKLKLKPA